MFILLMAILILSFFFLLRLSSFYQEKKELEARLERAENLITDLCLSNQAIIRHVAKKERNAFPCYNPN